LNQAVDTQPFTTKSEGVNPKTRAKTWLEAIGILVRFGLKAALILVLVQAIAYGYVSFQAKGLIYNSAKQVPARPAALVLGTSERLVTGEPNAFFTNRISASAALWNEGKVRLFIVSGERSPYYNEPEKMRRALISRGVPSYAIWLDAGGMRTLDSILRLRDVFGQTGIIIVTQRFHAERALLLAKAIELDAVALAAPDLPGSATNITHLRELPARLLALWDLAGIYGRHTPDKD
jgi:SanA protein